jgi:transposase
MDHRICAFDNKFAARAPEDDRARRLVTIPGIGVLSATALVAAIGDGGTIQSPSHSETRCQRRLNPDPLCSISPIES